MADFEKAVIKTLEFEGGYGNDSRDRGGETFCGVSRNNFPDWEGWQIVDAHKSHTVNFKREILTDAELPRLVHNWYKKEFWDKIRGEEIADQSVAFNIFDFAVNCGAVTVIRRIQGELALVRDGIVGVKTLTAINDQEPIAFVEAIKDSRRQRYYAIVQNDSTQRVFLNDWLRRTEEC